MFSKEEQKKINTAFWGIVKKELNKTPDAEGRFIQWLNYPIKIKDVFLRLKVNNELAMVSLDIQSADEGIRELIWEQLKELKKAMENNMEILPAWDKTVTNDAGLTIYQIRWELKNVSLYSKQDEKAIIHFFRTVLVEFDAFYFEFGEILKNLVR